MNRITFIGTILTPVLAFFGRKPPIKNSQVIAYAMGYGPEGFSDYILLRDNNGKISKRKITSKPPLPWSSTKEDFNEYEKRLNEFIQQHRYGRS